MSTFSRTLEYTALIATAILVVGYINVAEAGASGGDVPTDDGVSTAIEKSGVDLKDLFVHVRSVPIRGTKENPVFSVTAMAVREDMIVVSDVTSHQVTAFDFNGNLIFQTGQEGGGPGDFTNPIWIGFDTQGRIAVLESFGNNRLQLLSDEDGRPLGVVTQDIIVVPSEFQAFIERIDDNRQRLIFPRNAVPCQQGNDLCVIQEMTIDADLNVSDIVRFAPAKEVQPDAIGYPYILGRDPAGNSYVAHRIGGTHVAVYDKSGRFQNRISFRSAPEIFPLDHSALPRDHEAAVRAMSRTKYSSLVSIFWMGGDVIVDHETRSPGSADFPRHLSIFGADGLYKASTSAFNYSVVAAAGNALYFLEEDVASDYGSYVLHEYRYEGLQH